MMYDVIYYGIGILYYCYILFSIELKEGETLVGNDVPGPLFWGVVVGLLWPVTVPAGLALKLRKRREAKKAAAEKLRLEKEKFMREMGV